MLMEITHSSHIAKLRKGYFDKKQCRIVHDMF